MADIAAAAHHELMAVGMERDRFLEQVIRDYLADRRLHYALRAIESADVFVKKGLRDEAVLKGQDALDTAKQMGDRVTELKARLALRRSGIRTPRGEADACLDEIEAEAYASQRREIAAFLEN
jgi:hypothetical protein